MTYDRQPPPPSADDMVIGRSARTTVGAREVLARVLVGLTVASALSSGELVAAAEAQPFGSRRSFLVEVALVIDHHATDWHLDEPNRRLRSALGREGHKRDVDADGDLGELAAASDLASTSGRAAESADSETQIAEGQDAEGRDADAEPSGPGEPAPSPLGLRPPELPAGPQVTAPMEAHESDVQPATTTPATTSTIRVVDQTSRLRLWAGGDSLGEYVGNQLLHPIADPDLVDVRLDYNISTGLSRPDYFDWPARLREVMATDPSPEVLVFMVGGNDNQNMLVDGDVVETDTAAWYREYERRIRSIVDETSGAQLYWIGLPPMRDDDRNTIAVAVNEILRHVADQHETVTFIDLETQFAGPDGSYSAHIVDPDGQLRLARAADGVHITYTGSTWVASDFWDLVEARWSFEPISEGGEPPYLPDQPL